MNDHAYSLHFGTAHEDETWCRDGVCVCCDQAFEPLGLESFGYDPGFGFRAGANAWEEDGLPTIEIRQTDERAFADSESRLVDGDASAAMIEVTAPSGLGQVVARRTVAVEAQFAKAVRPDEALGSRLRGGERVVIAGQTPSAGMRS